MRLLSIIGAGYGDEGKGLAVDAMAQRLIDSGEQVTVVRVNGGAQAGHTVQTLDGRRHVFHQFGAGSLAGAATHWARGFVVSPMFLSRERRSLDNIGGRTDALTADPNVQVSTPWDILINQAAETARGEGRHGSCGMGFGETIEREENNWGLTLNDLVGPNLVDRIRLIREVWFPKRMAALGLDPDEYSDVALSDGLLAKFVQDCQETIIGLTILPDHEIGERGVIITEGAQGLGLDMNVGDFPHVTRSSTGLRNVIRLARDIGADVVDALYMTRAYGTRHGAGPLNGEGDISAWADVKDPTNAPNAWQGALRLGALDADSMIRRMDEDAEAVRAEADVCGISMNRMLGMSCLNQIKGEARVILGGETRCSDVPEMLLANAANAELFLLSTGPDKARCSWGRWVRSRGPIKKISDTQEDHPTVNGMM